MSTSQGETLQEVSSQAAMLLRCPGKRDTEAPLRYQYQCFEAEHSLLNAERSPLLVVPFVVRNQARLKGLGVTMTPLLISVNSSCLTHTLCLTLYDKGTVTSSIGCRLTATNSKSDEGQSSSVQHEKGQLLAGNSGANACDDYCCMLS